MDKEDKEDVIGNYRISKITSVKLSRYNGIDCDYWTKGYDITLTNVKNPFDYFIQYIPKEAYSEEEFKVGRELELVE